MPKKKGHPELSKLAGEHNWAIGRIKAKASTIQAWINELDRLSNDKTSKFTKQYLAQVKDELREAKYSMNSLHDLMIDEFADQRAALKQQLDKEKQDGNIS
jgi:preprotein translocase subunit SecA